MELVPRLRAPSTTAGSRCQHRAPNCSPIAVTLPVDAPSHRIARGVRRGGTIWWMAAALFAVVAGYGALMRLLRDGVWLAHDDWPGGVQLFSKQEYPVIVVPPE